MIELASWQLQGLSRDVAERYGKPHFMARYANGSVNSNRLEDGARCVCCGRPATNSHHWPPRSKGRAFHIPRPDGKGDHVLRPALFALCGSGTAGCHGAWHQGSVTAIWKWDSEEFERAWWDGTMLMAVEPHSEELYGYGCWELYDFRHSRIWEVWR